MRLTSLTAAALAVLCYSFGAAAGEGISASSLGLSDINDVVVGRQSQRAPSDEPSGFQSSAWLAALPSIEVSYLRSDEPSGTDETVLSLNLPLKSPLRREQDRELRTLAAEIESTERARRRLYFSGLLREAVWSERIERARAEFTDRKIALLIELLDRQEALFEARGASRYSLLLIRQELMDARILLEDQRKAARQWQQRYRQLTGLGSPPEEIAEAAPPADAPWHTHPDLQLLKLTWEQQRTRIAAASTQSTPWNLSVIARQEDSRELEENQYGLALEVPLSVFDTVAESSSSEWRESARGFWQQHDEVRLALEYRWQQLAEESRHLQTRRTLLAESVAISQELVEQSRLLRTQSEMGSEIWIRRLIGSLDTQADAAINELLIGQNLAMRRQAAGLPL